MTSKCAGICGLLLALSVLPASAQKPAGSDSAIGSGSAIDTSAMVPRQHRPRFVAPVDCTKTPNTDSSEWVGIDGWSSDTVEQTGTDADCNGKTPFYYVWYE